MNRTVLATANPDKLLELRTILAPLHADFCGVRELVPDWRVEETGSTLEQNALIKARTALKLTGLPAIADDTGLFVDVLGGAPGIYAARFAGDDCSYACNVRKLLGTMLCEENRSACFRTAAAYVSPGLEICVTGEVFGIILQEPQGEKGFGYDPVFRPEGLDCSFACCSAEEKNRFSHRARALEKLRRELAAGILSV